MMNQFIKNKLKKFIKESHYTFESTENVVDLFVDFIGKNINSINYDIFANEQEEKMWKGNVIEPEKEDFVLKFIDNTNNSKALVYTKKYENHPKGYKNDHIEVVYIKPSSHVIIQTGDYETPYENWHTLFCGKIESQKEFSMILKMIIL